MEIPARVRFEIEEMRYTILSAIDDRNHEIKKMVAEELNRLIDNFDFTTFIRNEVERHLKSVVRDSISAALSYKFRMAMEKVFQAGVDAFFENRIPMED